MSIPSRFISVAAAVLLILQLSTPGLYGARGKSELPADIRELRLGDRIPAFTLPGVDGRSYRQNDFDGSRLLMVVFLSNHCPYSHAIEDRLMQLIAETSREDLAVVAISPNHPEAVRLDELGYSNFNDSFEEMQAYAQERGFTFPYLYDGDTQTTSKAFGCLATPHVFLFDAERRLRYAGRFDDSRYHDPATVTSPDAQRAVEALLAGKPVPVPLTKPVGCSTKWRETIGQVRAVDAKWSAIPAGLAPIDVEGVKVLARNDSKRWRVINVWATWCAPCVEEFPALMQLARRFANRDLEMITISVDEMKHEGRVRDFLSRHRAVPSNRLRRELKKDGREDVNFIYSGKQMDELIEALDPEWPGPVPHTVIIAPGGRIVFRHTGAVDISTLQTRIVEELGAYYNER